MSDRELHECNTFMKANHNSLIVSFTAETLNFIERT